MLILIAYVVGVSIAVHLLNLLCIPAIVLVFAYRKWNDMNLVKSLIALLVSFVIVALVLFGLVPGFIKMAQQFELFFVNTIGMNFNSGALIYAAVSGYLRDVRLENVRDYERQLTLTMESEHSEWLARVEGGQYGDEDKKELDEAVAAFTARYCKTQP